MARRVMEFSFFSERPMVVTPFHTEDGCLAAQEYGARWLLVSDDERATQAGLDAFAVRSATIGSHGGYSLQELVCRR